MSDGPSRFPQTTRPDLADRRVSSAWLPRRDGRELEVRAPSPDQLFAAAGLALAGLLDDDGDGAEPDRLPVALQASDLDELLVAFLDDVLYLARVERFLAHRVERLEIHDLRLRAALTGLTGPERRDVPTIRGARTRVESRAVGWRAVVVLS